jgi:hypothetical protein
VRTGRHGRYRFLRTDELPGDAAVGYLGAQGFADARVSFRSAHEPATDVTYAVIASTTYGAWPLVRHLHAALMS